MFRKWMKSVLVLALLALAGVLARTGPAHAGGWVVITLDQLPEGVVAGEPISVGMMARQHGQTPWQVGSLQIQAEHVETGRQAAFTALPEGAPGHYVAELIFPAAGDWRWSVGAGMFPETQPMPSLSVAENSSFSALEPASRAPALLLSNALPILLGAGALLAFALGLWIILRARSRRLPVLASAGLMALCAGLAFTSYYSANAEANQTLPANRANAAAIEDPAITGQRLFLAKGCVVCHTNDRALQSSAAYGINAGPDLTQYSNDPKIIHTKLKDPQATNPAAQMPQLDLKVDEIEALVAFLNYHE